MHLLITGICGFVGSSLARRIVETGIDVKIIGVDNLIRRGSEKNLESLRHLGIQVIHGDLRLQSDVDALPNFDWLIDAAANPSVLAGADGQTSSRQLMEHNLIGTLNMLERCKALKAGFILLSTSRVYSISKLAALPVDVANNAYCLSTNGGQAGNNSFSSAGIREDFSTAAPLSLYGTSKLASESLAIEYGASFDFPVWINRCGVMAGAGQFGKADQGIFAYWINAHLRRWPLKYIGFDGHGHQVRDCLHPNDLADLVVQQLNHRTNTAKPQISNVSGGIASAMSLRQLTEWCNREFGVHQVGSDPTPRSFDLPWVVLDSTQAANVWNWQPKVPQDEILRGIAEHARANPDWLSVSR